MFVNHSSGSVFVSTLRTEVTINVDSKQYILPHLLHVSNDLRIIEKYTNIQEKKLYDISYCAPYLCVGIF